MVKVLQDITHGGTNNDTYEDKNLTFYDDDDKAIKSLSSTEVTKDDDDNELLVIDNVHTKKTEVDDLTANNPALFKNNVVINGNLTVKGDSTEEHTQDLFVGSDTITLRDGAESGLQEGEYSGIVINNYNGTDSLGLVAKNNGELRVGDYATVKVYWDATVDPPVYYSDKKLTIPIVIPTGSTVYKESEEDDLCTGYYVSNDDTQALLTKDDNIEDQRVIFYDGNKANSTSVTKDELEALTSKLQTIVGDDKIRVVDLGDSLVFSLTGNASTLVNKMGVFAYHYGYGLYKGIKFTFSVNDGAEKIITPEEYKQFDTINNGATLSLLKVDNTYEYITIPNNSSISLSVTPTAATLIALSEDNKLFYTNTTPNASDYNEGNIIVSDNTIEGNCLAITDEIAEGDYNVPTSDALFNFLQGWEPTINGSWSVNNWNISWSDS